ncbi:MAG: hypothetical protein HQL11_00935, partial [Candidatus Omnitrophica bacterium]|nr:hypothetical protein [Candidatus Omnitrophota bacterium]
MGSAHRKSHHGWFATLLGVGMVSVALHLTLVAQAADEGWQSFDNQTGLDQSFVRGYVQREYLNKFDNELEELEKRISEHLEDAEQARKDLAENPAVEILESPEIVKEGKYAEAFRFSHEARAGVVYDSNR